MKHSQTSRHQRALGRTPTCGEDDAALARVLVSCVVSSTILQYYSSTRTRSMDVRVAILQYSSTSTCNRYCNRCNRSCACCCNPSRQHSSPQSSAARVNCNTGTCSWRVGWVGGPFWHFGARFFLPRVFRILMTSSLCGGDDTLMTTDAPAIILLKIAIPMVRNTRVPPSLIISSQHPSLFNSFLSKQEAAPPILPDQLLFIRSQAARAPAPRHHPSLARRRTKRARVF